MNIFEVETTKEYFKKGKAKRRTLRHEIAFPSDVSEIKFKHWHDYFLLKEDDPDWAKEMEKLSPDKQLELMGKWTDEQWADYYTLILKYLECFTDSKTDALADAPLFSDGGNGLVSIYMSIVGMINSYKPKEIESFEYKGDTYVVDRLIVDRFGRKQHGGNLTMNQVLDALQYEHVFNVKDEKGVFQIKDRKFQIDIALAALLSKKVNADGSFDERPLDMQKRMEWTERKILHFMDASMCLALDIDFFFFNLKMNSNRILTLASFFNLSKSNSTQKP